MSRSGLEGTPFGDYIARSHENTPPPPASSRIQPRARRAAEEIIDLKEKIMELSGEKLLPEYILKKEKINFSEGYFHWPNQLPGVSEADEKEDDKYWTDSGDWAKARELKKQMDIRKTKPNHRFPSDVLGYYPIPHQPNRYIIDMTNEWAVGKYISAEHGGKPKKILIISKSDYPKMNVRDWEKKLAGGQ